LVDAKQCKTDADLIKKLGANTIYVYSVDVRDNHDGCMKEFADQGIYVWLQMGGFPRATETVRLS
jgi:1,3-beta-glucanosyltransferase GAS1